MSDFQGFFDQVKRQDAARTATELRLHPLQPDQAADGIATAKELGVPAGQVMAFPELFKDRLSQQRATTALSSAPKLADWLRSDPVNGALAKDDLENLSWWEKTTAFTGNALNRGVKRAGMAYNQAQAGFAAGRAQDSNRSLGEIIYDERAPVMVDGKEVSREWAGPGDLVSSLYRYSASRIGDLVGDDEEAAVQFQMQAAQVSEAISAIPMSPGAASARDRLGAIDSNGTIGEQLRSFAGAVAEDPTGFASFLAQVAAESLPGLAVSSAVGVVTRNPTAAAAALGLSSGAQEYGSGQMEVLQDSGHDLTTPEGALAAISDEALMRKAAARGETRGIIIGAMDGLSGGLAGQMLARSELGNLIVQGLAQSIIGGGGEAAAQLATDGKINVSDVLVEALAEFVTAPIEVAGVGGRAGLSQVRASVRAGKTGNTLDQASQQAQMSKLRERSPDAFKAALDRAGRGDDMIYLPAQGLREFFQARDVPFDAETADAWGIDRSTMAQMEISGGRVAVPMSNFAAYLAGTDAEAWVRENATMDPDEMSLADAASFDEAIQAQMEAAYEQQLSDMRAEAATRDSDQQVYDGVYSQLRGAGRSVDVAEKEARVFGAFFRSMSERVGEDSLDLARRYGLRIQGPDAPGIPRRRGALDAMLNDLRSGRKEQTGRTLTQFVIDEGGVQDIGGDVAALEGPRGLVAESREEIMARQAQPSMDGMPSSGRGLQLDELGRKAVEAGYFPELMGEAAGLNQGEAADLGRAVLNALSEEASGRPRYVEGDGPDPARAALNAALQERGLDPASLTNDEIAAALEADADGGAVYGQDRPTRQGSIQFPRTGIGGGGETVISLFETADLTTVIHESGHYFLEAMADLAAQPDAPQQIRDDMDAVREFIGATEGQEIGTESHETFARALEAYFMEGKAPSLALADVFARAKAWLLRVYRSIAGLNVQLTPEVREVFDRMLATDAEIANARAEVAADPLFREKPPGMTDTDWSTYQRMARRSAEDAEARLQEKTLEKVRREKEAWWKAERKALRAEVEARMNTEPRFRLVEGMANGRVLTPDGERPAPDLRIDRGALVDQFGDGILAEVSRTRLGGKRAIYGEDGVTPAEAAEMFGFAGPVEMIETLQNTGKRQDEISAEVDRIMLDRYGDTLNDGTIEQEAMDAIHNSQMQQKHVAEARHIATQLGRDTRSMTPALYRQRARLMLGRMTVREATAPARFLAAERKAGRDAQAAFAKVARGDSGALAVALQAKEQQILNAGLYDLSRQAETEIGKAREKAQSYGKKSVREKLEGGYIEQIDDLLDRHDFRKRGPGAVAKTERMREFIDRMIAEGREAELMIDPRMMDDARRVHYSRLSLDEFRALMDTVANLDHLGRFKQDLINGKKRRELARTAEAVADSVAKNMGTGRAKQESRLRYALDLVFTADTMMIDIDGGDEFGTAYQAIKEDIDAAYVQVDEMNRELAGQLDALFKVYDAKTIREMKRERVIPGTRFVWSKWQAISVAMNTGNDDNMARLLSPDAHPSQRMTREDLDAILATLDKRDWDFVQSMWDQINSYWPQIEAVTQRRTGVKPGKVEARQVMTPFGAYKGGYYPIKYDAGLGARAAVDAKTENDSFMSAGRFAKAQTKSGHTKSRMQTGNGRTLMLDMSVAFTHMRDVVRDIALSEAVDNANRVLNHNDVTQAFIEAGRKADHDVLNLWLKDVARGPIVHTDALNQFARFVKTNFTLSRLALNLKTVLLQATGVAQSAVVVGRRPMARAYADYLKRPAESAAEVMAASEFMRRRQTTFDKDIQDFANDTLDTSPMRSRWSRSLEGAARFGFAPMTKMQFYSVDVPTWMAGYRNGLRRFDGDADRAVAFADRMVARAQDSGAMPDRAAVSRGTLSEDIRQAEFVRLFTTLQGYMIAKWNRGYVEGKRGARAVRDADTAAQRFAATADMATNLMMLYVVEGAMMGLLYAAMAAGDDEDDELSGEKMMTWLAGETFGTVIGGFPLVRDAWSGFSDFGDTGGVLGSVLKVPASLYKQAVQGENDRALRKAVGDVIGLATGLPTVATLRPVEGLLDEEGGSVWGALMGFNPLAD